MRDMAQTHGVNDCKMTRRENLLIHGMGETGRSKLIGLNQHLSYVKGEETAVRIVANEV